MILKFRWLPSKSHTTTASTNLHPLLTISPLKFPPLFSIKISNYSTFLFYILALLAPFQHILTLNNIFPNYNHLYYSIFHKKAIRFDISITVWRSCQPQTSIVQAYYRLYTSKSVYCKLLFMSTSYYRNYCCWYWYHRSLGGDPKMLELKIYGKEDNSYFPLSQQFIP